MQALLFAGAWRMAWQQIAHQRDVLQTLYEAAREADSAIPRPPFFNLSSITEEQARAVRDFFDAHGQARGARDAYATAIVMFFDDAFRMLRTFYDRIPDGETPLQVRVRGIDVATIFRAAGNNVRHHRDWLVSPRDLAQPRLAVENASVIANLMGKSPPTRESVSLWAANWAWPMVAVVSDGTFERLLRTVIAAMDEMLANAGETTNEDVLAYRDRYPILS